MLVLFLSPAIVLAEGSKELNSNGGNRAYLYSSKVADAHSFPFPTLGTMKVYVKAGEKLNLGSSAQGNGIGTINLRAPDGTTYSSGNSTAAGLIHNSTEEQAGPQLTGGLPANGYIPYTVTASAAQEGIWEVDFIGPAAALGTETVLPDATQSAASWVQPAGPFIAAFDVTVVDAGNTPLKGRVFTNVFCGQISSFAGGFNGIFYILTKDGYQYILDNNGQAGNGFSFFVNNKGIKTADGKASYQSLNTVGSPLIHDPTSPDTESDVTQKIFFNTPSGDLPGSAKTPDGTSTWLTNPPTIPTVDHTEFIGFEGTSGRAGTSPLGGTFGFNVTSTTNGTYTLIIDANNNGVYTDAVDRKLTGAVVNGYNGVIWDGLDGAGNKLVAGTTQYNASLVVTLFNAEVHFPFIDVERNVNGIKLTRITGNNAPDNTIYWDDSQITLTGTPSNPLVNLTGISSLVNGHKWGSPATTNDPSANFEFGNEKSIDTWAYVAIPAINTTLTFTVAEADLEVSSLTSDVTTGCVGQTVNYTVVVKNNGPSDVTGTTFAFNFPTELTGIKVTSTATTGTPTITLDSTGKAKYVAVMDMPNGSVRTFNITGKVAKLPTGALNVTATILRPADVTDPDATKPDTPAPTDPQAECDASGVGCNNIKTNSITFLAAPDAGPDQTVDKDKTATLTANQTGNWTQVGTTPAVANINTPNGSKTDVSGLSEVGPYKFAFTNANGCTDTVTVNVTSSKLGNANVVTPNGDGKNDVLTIPDINLYPGSKLSIYNRWGNEVYHSDNYGNDWAGKGLADGTYYFVLNRREANGTFRVFKDWIYLKH